MIYGSVLPLTTSTPHRKVEFTENIVFQKQKPHFFQNKEAAESEQKTSTGNIIHKVVC